MGVWTRRDLLKAAIATSPFAIGSPTGLNAAVARARKSGSRILIPTQGTGGSPVVVCTANVSTDVNPRARAWTYIGEVLNRAGLFHSQVAPEQLETLTQQPKSVLVLAGNLPLTAAQRDLITAWVRQGGALIGIAGTSGLDEVFGVASGTPLADGWIKVTAAEHPLTKALRSSLHVFGGYGVKASTATSLAGLESGGRSKGSAVLENRFGKGLAVLLAPDLLFSIVNLQQGFSVLQDGKPAPDDSAPLNDGVLKAEDGHVLDWQRDRTVPTGDGPPIFLEPVSDELREIILRSIFYAARQQQLRLPVLWYWPRQLPAIGHISHDTDGNDPAKAPAMLEVLNRCRVKSTWCTLFPGGYPAEFYRTLQAQDFEIAMHYDAMTGGPQTSWSKENFLMQHRWLLKEAGLREIVSNKNHYTRWEGRLDFYRWCEELGIKADQTRGPSKKGTIGFPLGGSQPYFPLDDEREQPRILNVLEVNLLTQDMVVFCPPLYGRPLLDSARHHHGVAHFLFHPAHILKPNVADNLTGLVDYGRTQGLEWWTSRQIWQWETIRRGVTARMDASGNLALQAANPVQQATLLVLRSGTGPQPLMQEGRPLASKPFALYGFDFDAVTLDLSGQTMLRLA